MSYKNILYEKTDHIARIIFNRPEKRNSLNSQLISELIKAVTEADLDNDVNAIVLTGSGKSFCAGGDISDFAELTSKTAPLIQEDGLASNEVFRLGCLVRKPLIASVNGHALGGGCGLVAMCHLSIASETAKFGTPEVKIGIFPFVIFPLLIRALGPRKALELALTGEIITAPEAHRIGLVNRVVPPDQLEEETLKLARTVAGHSPLVLRLGLEAFNNIINMEMEKAFRYLNALRVVDFMSEDLKEGAMAFLEKREPKWQGR